MLEGKFDSQDFLGLALYDDAKRKSCDFDSVFEGVMKQEYSESPPQSDPLPIFGFELDKQLLSMDRVRM